MTRSRSQTRGPLAIQQNREIALTAVGAVAVVAALTVALVGGAGVAKPTPGITKTPTPAATHAHSTPTVKPPHHVASDVS